MVCSQICVLSMENTNDLAGNVQALGEKSSLIPLTQKSTKKACSQT